LAQAIDDAELIRGGHVVEAGLSQAARADAGKRSGLSSTYRLAPCNSGCRHVAPPQKGFQPTSIIL